MSNDSIHFPADEAAKFRDRVIIAAGEDAHTGSKKLAALLERIRSGEEPPLTRQETGSLTDVHKFKRKRGQSEKREYHALLTQMAVERYHELRAQGRSGDAAITAVIAEMEHLRLFTPETIKNALHRSQHWPSKRRKSIKLRK